MHAAVRIIAFIHLLYFLSYFSGLATRIHYCLYFFMRLFEMWKYVLLGTYINLTHNNINNNKIKYDFVSCGFKLMDSKPDAE